MIKLIVGVGENNLIGKGNMLPWRIKEELKHFKRTTMGNAVLFGRKTLDAIPATLEGRELYSFGRTPSKKQYAVNILSEEELENLFANYRDSEDTLFIAGGKYIYEHYYKEADEIVLTQVKKQNLEGDVYLEWDLSDYEKSLVSTNEKFDVFLYKRKK